MDINKIGFFIEFMLDNKIESLNFEVYGVSYEKESGDIFFWNNCDIIARGTTKNVKGIRDFKEKVANLILNENNGGLTC